MVSIADCDTITVLDASNNKYKVRLQWTDAPERCTCAAATDSASPIQAATPALADCVTH